MATQIFAHINNVERYSFWATVCKTVRPIVVSPVQPLQDLRRVWLTREIVSFKINIIILLHKNELLSHDLVNLSHGGLS